MLKGMKALCATLLVGAAACVAWAAVEPTIEVTAPTTAKVGQKFTVLVHATTGSPTEGSTIHVVVTVTQLTRNGGGGSKRTISVTKDNHSTVDIPIDTLALGSAFGATVDVDVTSFTPEGGPSSATASHFISYTRGNGQ